MNPYQERAHEYIISGLGYPIPSAYPYEKHPPLRGWTGRKGAIPDAEQVEQWRVDYLNSNLLVRMAPDVVGIDVDHYEDKHGADTITEIARSHGSMPLTAVSTARTLPSGIYWYRLRSWMDTDKMRDPGEHVEVIRYEHRYAVAPPSWHPGTQTRYRWNSTRYVTPTIEHLAYLPTEWYVHLTRGCSCFESERADRRRIMRRLTSRPNGAAGEMAARKDLSEAVNALSLATHGQRNNMLSSIAGRFMLYDVVINNTLGVDEVVKALEDAAIKTGLMQHEAERTIKSAFDWAVREGITR